MIYKTVSVELKNIIQQVFESNKFENFRLGGGTALTLQLGHRISIDADFISPVDFDRDEVLKQVLSIFPQATDIHQGTFGVFLKSDNIKIDFLSWNLPFIRPALTSGQWRLLDIADITAMKFFAILQRGEKKDYIDIAELLKTHDLSTLISFYLERHPGSDASVILRFLSSYSDIEQQPMPQMLNQTTWNGSKQIIQNSISDFIKKGA
jgi:predicted nucleotidyltransferase component of viral defense system